MNARVNSLIGFGAGGSGGAALEFTVHATVDSGGGNITVPADVADGDLGILVEGGYQTPSVTTPYTGWNQAGLYTYSVYNRSAIYYKKLTTADQSTTLTTFAGTSPGYDGAILIVLRPNKDLGTIGTGNWDADGSTGAADVTTGMSSDVQYERLYIGGSYVVNVSTEHRLDPDNSPYDFEEEAIGANEYVGCQGKVYLTDVYGGTVTGNNGASSAFNAGMSFYFKFNI